MRHLLLPATLLAIFCSCNTDKEDNDPISNNQAVAWIKDYGGSNYDFAKSVVQLPGGDYVMAGTSRSVDGDVPGGRVGYDPWLARIDTTGKLIWSNAFGTNADEHTGSLVTTQDGGFIVAGHVGLN